MTPHASPSWGFSPDFLFPVRAPDPLQPADRYREGTCGPQFWGVGDRTSMLSPPPVGHGPLVLLLPVPAGITGWSRWGSSPSLLQPEAGQPHSVQGAGPGQPVVVTPLSLLLLIRQPLGKLLISRWLSSPSSASAPVFLPAPSSLPRGPSCRESTGAWSHPSGHSSRGPGGTWPRKCAPAWVDFPFHRPSPIHPVQRCPGVTSSRKPSIHLAWVAHVDLSSLGFCLSPAH